MSQRNHRGINVRMKEDDARKAQQRADTLGCEAWNERLAQLGGPLQPSPSLRAAINGGYAWLRIACNACQQNAWIDLKKVRRPPDTQIWRLEASLSCQPCRQGRRYGPRAKIEMLCQYDKQSGAKPFQERD